MFVPLGLVVALSSIAGVLAALICVSSTIVGTRSARDVRCYSFESDLAMAGLDISRCHVVAEVIGTTHVRRHCWTHDVFFDDSVPCPRAGR